MVTRDEQHSTRGRANALRMVLSGALPPSELAGERMHEVMDLCVECKGCTGECPSRVNMTRLKSEWLSHYYAQNGVPLRARLFGNIRALNQVGSALAPLSNLATRLPGMRVAQEKLLGISRRRALPAFAREPFHRWFRRRGMGDRAWGIGRKPVSPTSHPLSPIPRTVVLFPDTFADYNEPHVAKAAVRVLEAAGYRVILPEKRVCCGRPLISKGLLDQMRPLALRQLDALASYAEAGLPIVGLEPSCILTFRDELPDLVDDPRAEVLARQTFLFDEFLARELREGRARLHLQGMGAGGWGIENDKVPHPPRSFLLHGHCHQKAIVGTSHALRLLRMIPGAEVREVDSGCCGMAGSFGYEAEHYAISHKVGACALFPAVRALDEQAEVVAMGTSCRHQIADGVGRRARHLAEVLAEALG
jgi:Fe-S oxidoreductase